MKFENLKDVLISITDVKTQLGNIVKNKLTKVIIKNNEPVSVIMPYEDYVKITEQVGDNQSFLAPIGQDMTLENGVQIMVGVESNGNQIGIKLFRKMKTSGDYKLHHTFYISAPRVEDTYTTQELLDMHS